MKSILKLNIILLFSLLFSCQSDRITYDLNLDEYVRIALILDNNGDPVAALSKTGNQYVSRYEHSGFGTVNIPVGVTAPSLDSELKVYYSSKFYGDFTDATITPDSFLIFSPEKYWDTIQINFNSRWDTLVWDSILVQLDSTSLFNIKIGYPFGNEAHDHLSVILGDLTLPYTAQSPNSFSLVGTKGESYNFSVIFNNGVSADDLDGIDLLEEDFSDFDYTLVQNPVTTVDEEVSFTLTLDEDLNNEQKTYECQFTIAQLEGYTLTGNTTFNFTKDATNQANNNINVAHHFYDIASDAYNRLYMWIFIDYNNDGNCIWRKTYQHCVPVEVVADHPNAVYNEEDGKYYHAFKLGFDSPNEGRTTNSFGLKYWFNNESTDADVSPGFNILDAMEFYPKDGTSYTEGTVSVVEQDIVITGEGNSHTISIAGEGCYYYLDGSQETYNDSIFEIDLQFEATNKELFGGTQTMQYIMLNRNPGSSEKPDSLMQSCFTPVDL